MSWRWASLCALACALFGAAPGPAAAFQTGDVYWAHGACDNPPCSVHEVDAGTGAVTPLAATEPAPGQLAWNAAVTEVYVPQFAPDTILSVTAGGVVSTFATNIDGPTGLLRTSGGTLLAVSYRDGAVYDATGGGDLSAASVFAQGLSTPRNLLETSSGDLLIADQTRRAVYDISVGGGADFSAAQPFADGFSQGVYDLVEDGAGRIYVSSGGGVFDITGGGSVGGPGITLHATGRTFIGLAVDGAGRLLASEFQTGRVFDVTAAGDYTAASPVATVSGGFGDSALDTVPEGGSGGGPPVVPALGPFGYGVLFSLLAATGARARRR